MRNDLEKDTLVFICCNQKSVGKCCAVGDAENIFTYLKKELNFKRGQFSPGRRVKAVKTSCLGRCANGPNILIHPTNTWYTYTKTSDIDDIIDEHLTKGNIVNRLLNDADD